MRSMLLTLLLVLTYSLPASADGYSYFQERENISTKEKLATFGTLYAGQWLFYMVSQKQTIQEEGSFENWRTYPFSPRFDYDSFDFNIIRHSLAGSFFYLTYRSRGYDVRTAFLWTALTSLAFEFTIETVTERPSFQDMYQTPILGTVLGMGLESVSNYFHEKDNFWGRGLGYLFNPLTLVPSPARKDMSFVPLLERDHLRGFAVQVRF